MRYLFYPFNDNNGGDTLNALAGSDTPAALVIYVGKAGGSHLLAEVSGDDEIHHGWSRRPRV